MDNRNGVLNYEVPQVEVIEVEVEQGIAATGGGEGGNPEPF